VVAAVLFGIAGDVDQQPPLALVVVALQLNLAS
jgi:hypothetical protein